jgi:hypothetical protein
LRKGDEIGCTYGVFDELEIEFPEGDPGCGRELVPGGAVLRHRGLALGRPGAQAVGPFAHFRLVDEDDGSRAVF